MRFWIREAAGWVLVLLGLAAFGLAIWFLLNGRYIATGPASLIGIFLFRGGIHLLKVAVAARICLQAQEKARPQPVPSFSRRIGQR
jgi:hypothetical protein